MDGSTTLSGRWDGGVSPFRMSWQKMMMWWFIVGDAILFAGFLASYGFSRLGTANWPDQSQVFDLNFMGTFLACQVFGRYMVGQDGGAVLNIASAGADRPLTRSVAYSAAKAAVVNFTKWLAVHVSQEYSPHIRVNALMPGFFLTEQNRFLLLDEHSGELTTTYSHLGNYHVTVPAGKFEAAVIKRTLKGSVGPASVDDLRYLLVVKGTGVVAAAGTDDLSAGIFVHRHDKSGRVLTK